MKIPPNKVADIQLHLLKTWFFIAAFTPLWVILIINSCLDKPLNPYTIISCIVLTVLGFLIISYIKKKEHMKTNRRYFEIHKKSNITRDTVFYSLTYIPILLIGRFEEQEFPILIVWFVTVYILYTKTNLFHVNPIIIIWYNIYLVTDDSYNDVIMVSKTKLMIGTKVPYQEIIPDLNVVINE